ncbi:MAG: Rne/Rng family ribonuclease, partial [Hyphomicrobiales bacterium]|nr:Rne/Rng family ribonuclease [Hyphomicrobiales bacterium]
ANSPDRKRLKSVLGELDIPEGMAVIVRTAGAERSRAEIKRDYEYLLRAWDNVRTLTLESTAPTLVYEEGDLIRRSIRDLYSRDIDEIIVDGDEGYRQAKDFMKLLIPSHAKKVQPHKDNAVPLLQRYQIESQLDAIHSPEVQLRSGGYIVINPTEALVAIDVNSGRATRERNIEETALRTNLEAAEEVARQVRLRDLAGLIVVDFIDMEVTRNQIKVERQLKEAMRTDRARIQVGRISPFGLLEFSRQRLRPSILETSSEPCPYCAGTGVRRSTESTALYVLRAIEEEGLRRRAEEITVFVPTEVALYILNNKREALAEIEQKYEFSVRLENDDSLIPPANRIERGKPKPQAKTGRPQAANDDVVAEDEQEEGGKRRRRRRPRRRKRSEDRDLAADAADTLNGDEADLDAEDADEAVAEAAEERGEPGDEGEDGNNRRRRRGRRGGRRRRKSTDAMAADGESPDLEEAGEGEEAAETSPAAEAAEASPAAEGDEASPAAEGDEAAVAEASEESETEGDAKPARTRRSRRRPRKAAAEDQPTEGETAEGETAEAEAQDAEPAAKRPRRRSRSARAEETPEPVVEAAEETSVEQAVEMAAEAPGEVAEEPVAEPETAEEDQQPVPETAAEDEGEVKPEVSEPEVSEPEVPDAEMSEPDLAAAPEAPDHSRTEVITIGGDESGEKKPTRRGWWNRISG